MTVETSLTVVDRGRSKSHWLGAEGLAWAREVNIERAFKHGFLSKAIKGEIRPKCRNCRQVSKASDRISANVGISPIQKQT